MCWGTDIFKYSKTWWFFELNRVLQTKESHTPIRTQVADVQRLCGRESQVSVEMKHYSANLVELILKIAVL